MKNDFNSKGWWIDFFSFQSKWLMVTHISIGQLNEKIGSATLYSTSRADWGKKTRFTTVWVVYISVSLLS